MFSIFLFLSTMLQACCLPTTGPSPTPLLPLTDTPLPPVPCQSKSIKGSRPWLATSTTATDGRPSKGYHTDVAKTFRNGIDGPADEMLKRVQAKQPPDFTYRYREGRLESVIDAKGNLEASFHYENGAITAYEEGTGPHHITSWDGYGRPMAERFKYGDDAEVWLENTRTYPPGPPRFAVPYYIVGIGVYWGESTYIVHDDDRTTTTTYTLDGPGGMPSESRLNDIVTTFHYGDDCTPENLHSW